MNHFESHHHSAQLGLNSLAWLGQKIRIHPWLHPGPILAPSWPHPWLHPGSLAPSPRLHPWFWPKYSWRVIFAYKKVQSSAFFVGKCNNVVKRLQSVSRYRQHCVDVHSLRRFTQLFAMSVSDPIYTSKSTSMSSEIRLEFLSDSWVTDAVVTDASWKGKIAGSIHCSG
jgi:hypothetical protein